MNASILAVLVLAGKRVLFVDSLRLLFAGSWGQLEGFVWWGPSYFVPRWRTDRDVLSGIDRCLRSD